MTMSDWEPETGSDLGDDGELLAEPLDDEDADLDGDLDDEEADPFDE